MTNEKVKEFERKQILFSFVALIIILGISIFANVVYVNSVAEQTTKIISRVIQLNDFREAALIFEEGRLSTFESINYQSTVPGKSFTLPSIVNETADAKFSHKILFSSVEFKVEDPLASNIDGTIIYSYERFHFLPYAFLVWLLLNIVSIPQTQILKRKLTDDFNSRQKEIEENKRIQVVSEIAKQVAHDIRSPLTALNMIVASSQDMPSERQHIIKEVSRRINEIANDLLKQSKEEPLLVDTISKNGSSVDLRKVVESMVSEKRILFGKKPGISLAFDTLSPSETFVKVKESEIKRIFSNLINNSYEAFENESGEIKVGIREYQHKVAVIIQDNGSGIPPEVLHRLGTEKGITHGKSDRGSDSGSGLAIYYAKKLVESWFGQFSIHSKMGVGTTVEIVLPRQFS